MDPLYSPHCCSSTDQYFVVDDQSPPMMAPTRPLPDSLSLLLSSSSASAYASGGSLLRPPPPPQPPLSCPPMRRKRRLHLQQRQNGGQPPLHAVQGELRMKRSRTASTVAPASTSSVGSRCSRLVLATLVLLAFATLLPLAIFLFFFTGKQLHLHEHASAPPSASRPAPSVDAIGSSSSDHYRLHLHQHHFRHGSSLSPASSVDGAHLPELLPVGVPVHFALPAHHLLFTQLSPLGQNARLLLNLTVSPKARIVLLARQSLRPTPGAHDWQKIVSGDKLHPLTTDRNGREMALLRQALISHFLTAGKWHFGFLNDREQTEPITLSAIVKENDENGYKLSAFADSSSSDTPCQFDCFGKGLCRVGQCVCYPGYGGTFCEETTCPVLCSGNGMFSNGKCQCYDGFKGDECQLLDDWCEDPTCAGHGQCDSVGKCRCHEGWTGPNCAERECPGRICAGRGVCHGGKCFCALGWTGEGCERKTTEEKQDGREVGNEQQIDGHDDKKLTTRTKLELSADARRSRCGLGCGEHGTCTVEGHCLCQQGWAGDNCQIAEPCAHNCSNGGQCELSAEGWRCQCNSAHFGDHCQFPRGERSCNDGRDNDGDGLTDCEDSVECCAHPSCASDSLCLALPFPHNVIVNSRRSLLVDSSAQPFFDRFKFLFDASEHSVQRYADIRLLDPKRVSVLRGRVFSSRGGPMTGVRISDSENPQHGFSLSRSAVMDESDGTAAGTFELALNGGGMVSVQFVRQPFGRVPLTFYLPPNRLVNVGTVWLDGRPTRSDFSVPSPFTVAHCITSLVDWHFRPSVFFVARSLSSSAAVVSPPISDHFFITPKLAVDSRIVSLAIPIPGTVHSIVYSSSRAVGARSMLRVQLLGNKLPEGILRVELALEIDGVRHERTFAPRKLLWHEFVWDRQNAFGQSEYGHRRGQMYVGYHLSHCASPVRHFSSFQLDANALPSSLLPPAWSLSCVHRLHPLQGLLQRGDTHNLQRLRSVTPTIRTIAGVPTPTVDSATNGRRRALGQCGGTGTSVSECVGRREKAHEATLYAASAALAAASDGSLFVGDAELIRRVTPGAEFVDTLLRIDPIDASHPYFLAVHPFTNQLHISLPLKRQILRVVDVGHYEMVLGPNSLTFPKGIAFDNHANLFVLDGRNLKKFLLSREETASAASQIVVEELISGDQKRGWRPFKGCSRMATLAELILEWPTALAWDPISGQLFLLDSSSVIFRIDFQLGIVMIVAGTQTDCAVDGDAEKAMIEAITFSPEEGTLFWTETDEKRTNLIKCLLMARNYPPGEVSTVAGRTTKCDCEHKSETNCHCERRRPPVTGDGGDPELVPGQLAVLPSGTLAFVDQAIAAIRQIDEHSSLAQFDAVAKMYRVNSTETDELLEFDERGRHLRTLAWDSSIGKTVLKRTISYSDEEAAASTGGGPMLVVNIVEERQGQQPTQVKVTKNAQGGTEQWTIDTVKDGHVVEIQQQQVPQSDQGTIVNNISITSLPHPIRLQFTRDGLLEKMTINGTAHTTFAYDNQTRLPTNARFMDGTEFELVGPELEAKARWVTRIKQRGKAEENDELWTLVEQEDSGVGNRSATLLRDEKVVAAFPPLSHHFRETVADADLFILPNMSSKWHSNRRHPPRARRKLGSPRVNELTHY